MASYKLIRDCGDEGALDLRAKNCALRIDSGGHGGDVESAYLKSNTPSPRLRPPVLGGGGNAKCTPPSGRLVSLDVFRGLTVVVNFLSFFTHNFLLGEIPTLFKSLLLFALFKVNVFTVITNFYCQHEIKSEIFIPTMNV